MRRLSCFVVCRFAFFVRIFCLIFHSWICPAEALWFDDTRPEKINRKLEFWWDDSERFRSLRLLTSEQACQAQGRHFFITGTMAHRTSQTPTYTRKSPFHLPAHTDARSVAQNGVDAHLARLAHTTINNHVNHFNLAQISNAVDSSRLAAAQTLHEWRRRVGNGSTLEYARKHIPAESAETKKEAWILETS